MERDELIRYLEQNPWNNTFRKDLFRVVEAATPEYSEALLNCLLAFQPDLRDSDILGMALDRLPDEALDRLAAKTIDQLENHAASDLAEQLLARICLQRPGALHPFLEKIYQLRPNRKNYAEAWPWRHAGTPALNFLQAHWDTAATDVERLTIWSYWLEMRTPESLGRVIALADQVGKPVSLEGELENAGFRAAHASLYRGQTQHLIFDKDYLGRSHSHQIHSTWHLAGPDTEYRFGGPGVTRCGLCGEIQHHLLTLPGHQVFSPWHCEESAAMMVLEACLSCMTWEEPVLYYRHDADGLPYALINRDLEPEFPAGPLRETTVRLVPTPARWQWQDWGVSNGRENLNRLGGHPTWIQSPEYPKCPDCGQTMNFFLQLDSDLPLGDGTVWQWGSGGVCYAFSCSGCRSTAYLWQCT